MPFEVLFEDTHLLVLNKPAGLLSQGGDLDVAGAPEVGTNTPNLVDLLRAYFGRNYVGLVHRLDRNTSGLMVVAKRTKAAGRLSEALKEGLLVRRYQAILEGDITQGPQGNTAIQVKHGQENFEVKWQDTIYKDSKNNKSHVIDPGQRSPANAKSAVLFLKLLKTIRNNKGVFSLVEFSLETGRGHQIRVQAAHRGLPLLGDFKYGAKAVGLIDRPALHSVYLEFPHPMSKATLKFNLPLPPDMARIT